METESKRVKITKVEVNRMPCNCIYECPFVKFDRWSNTCELLLYSVTGYTESIHRDCPLTVEGVK
jgi:hypothetical protein